MDMDYCHYIMVPTRLATTGPCHLDLPEILTEAQTTTTPVVKQVLRMDQIHGATGGHSRGPFARPGNSKSHQEGWFKK